MPNVLNVRRVAVLGAGVMGAQIAAHLVNAGFPVLLFDLPAAGTAKSATAAGGIDRLQGLQPAPLGAPPLAAHITPCNYDDDLPLLADCGLVIEAVAERLELKLALYARVAPHLGDGSVFATNTSGLSLARLAAGLPAAIAPRFCGMHFFNPPRYMALVELIPAPQTDAALLDALETLLVTRLGKSVVRAKDTPNFIGNRVGVFALLAVLHHAGRLGLGFDVVDALTGPLIGRPRSATFRTADVVGLDTFAHVVATLREGLPDDPWQVFYGLPAWMDTLIADGALGQKTRRGVYRKTGDTIEVYDAVSATYRPAAGGVAPEVEAILKDADVARRFARLRDSTHPQADFLWSAWRDTFHYCAVHLAAIADTARDVDCALRWGFAWSAGVFETWQAAGWQTIARALAADLAAGRTMARAPLPAWVTDPARSGVHDAHGSYSPTARRQVAPPALSVYRRQRRPQVPFDPPRGAGRTLFETSSVRCWQLDDKVAILSFTTKQHTMDEGVLDGLLQALDWTERHAAGLVIAQSEPPFSAGANLRRERGTADAAPQWMKAIKRRASSLVLDVARRLGLADALMAGRLSEVERLVAHFQTTHQTLRYAPVPVVAAVDGLALGGGCELLMHCDRVVAAFESYPGLVESGVGLVPAGGGCKELALRASAGTGPGDDVFPAIRRSFETVALATVARSAVEARTLGFLQRGDPLVMNRHEVLHVALSEVRALDDAGYRPPLPPTAIRVAGRDGAATLRAHLANLRAGNRISEHDVRVGTALAHALCGGDVDAGSTVDEAWLLKLEREQFMALIATAATQARIAHLLKTGKPLRN